MVLRDLIASVITGGTLNTVYTTATDYIRSVYDDSGASPALRIYGSSSSSGVDGTSGTNGATGSSGSSGTNGSVDPNILSPQSILYKNEAGVLTGSTGLKYTQYNSLIVGDNCSAPLTNSIAVGDSCLAYGHNSFAIGRSVVVPGTWSGGFGFSQSIGGLVNFSTGLQSSNQSPLAGVSMGSHLDVIGATQTVIGKYNVATGNTVISDWQYPTYDPNNPLFIIGCGTGSTFKRNGFIVRENMNAEFGGSLSVAGGISGVIDAIGFEIRNLSTGQTYILDLYAPYNYNISGISYKSNSGTCVFDIQYNLSGITGLSGLSGTTSITNTYITSNNSVNATDEITLYIKTITNNATILSGTLKNMRT